MLGHACRRGRPVYCAAGARRRQGQAHSRPADAGRGGGGEGGQEGDGTRDGSGVGAGNRAQADVCNHFAPRRGQDDSDRELLLYGGALQEAGAVKAKGERRRATSDFMQIEQERGISISSTALQFEYDGKQINLLDTRATRISPRTPTAQSQQRTTQSCCSMAPKASRRRRSSSLTW
jgi:hypothetical protein